jgi:hypothetical protein
MLVCMRTTINLPNALAEAAKKRAATEGRTFTSLVEEGLRMVLDQEEPVGPADPLPTYGRPGDRFLVDITDKEALYAVLDADTDLTRMRW